MTSIYQNPVILRDGSIFDGCTFELIRSEEDRSLVMDSNGDKFWLNNGKLDFGVAVKE